MAEESGSGLSAEAFDLLNLQRHVGWTRRQTEVQLSAGPVSHAIDGDGFRHLLLPIEDGAQDVTDDSSRGVSVSTRDLIDDEGAGRRFVDVRCNEVRLIDLFSVVCDEIVALAAEYPDRPGVACTIVLDRWRELLGPGSKRLIGENALKGLIAELHLLEDLARLDPVRAMALWTGPDRSRHDFIGSLAAVEVKASALVDDIRVQIHGLSQLERPTGKELYLVIERLEVEPAGRDSLRDILLRLFRAGVSESALYKSLRMVGVEPAHVDQLSALRLDLRERRAYRVDDAFPCLTPATISGMAAQDRVSSVSYVLDLGAQPPVPMEDPWVEALAELVLQPGKGVGS